MTSPAITKSPDNQKAENKSPTHSAGAPAGGAAERAPSRAESATTSAGASTALQSEPFSWFRIFKLADLMMKQGC